MSSSNNIRSSQLGRRLETEWDGLVEEYLPVREEGSIWRSSESAHPPTRVNQGWKLHVSATLLSATATLRRCAAILGPTSIRWKAPQSLEVVRHLNAGLYHGYSQIGKIITVYAGEAGIARQIASAIDEALTGSCGPAVPFDVPFRRGSVVYFRYGVIDPIEEIMEEGHKLPAIRHPSGHLVPDRRAARHAVPDWLEDTISIRGEITKAEPSLPLSYLVYEAISQRGKGGVYRALDVSMAPARKCVVKEGRLHGETDWDGRDGRSRVMHEERVLRHLAAVGVRVPQVLSSFVCSENCYLVLEHLDGQNLRAAVTRSEGRDPARSEIASQIAEELSRIHAAGWAWRDCKAANVILSPAGVRLLDFEGACPASDPDELPWGSPGHIPPEWPDPRYVLEHDLYALGSVIHFIVTSRLPDGTFAHLDDPTVPTPLVHIVKALLDTDPERRPSAMEVRDSLFQLRL